MITGQTGWRMCAVLVVVGGVCLRGVAAATAPRDRGFAQGDLDVAEKEACRTNLLLIFDAIQAYREAHQALPDTLSDLLSQKFLLDHEVLNCPTSRRTGQRSYEKAGYRPSEVTDPRTTYLYEFRTNAIPKSLAGGSRRSMREWKQLQMGLLGSEVPIVRCLMHPRNLNLAFGGTVYESQGDWEKNYTSLVSRDELWFPRLFAKGKELRILSIPARVPGADRYLVDLSDFYNASLTKCWSGEEPCPAFTSLDTGLQSLDGVRFDVRGLIQLYADAAWLDVFPVAVTNIPLGLTGRRLHFLHAATRSVRPATEIGMYLVHYENGLTNRIPIIYGSRIAQWQPEPRERVSGEGCRVVWLGTNAATLPGVKPFALYHARWDNPLPEIRMRSLDFGSSRTKSGPFVVAITVEP